MNILDEWEKVAQEATPGRWTRRQARIPVDGEYDWAVAAPVRGETKCIGEFFGRVSELGVVDAGANALHAITFQPDNVRILINIAKAAQNMEYVHFEDTNQYECPECHYKQGDGHYQDCTWGKSLEKLREVEACKTIEENL